jgi:hypothetical protein
MGLCLRERERMANDIIFCFLMIALGRGVVKLLPGDHEVMGSSLENNLLQKCRKILCT